MAMLVVLHLLVLLLLLSASTAFARRNSEVRTLLELKSSLDPDGLFLPSWSFHRDPCRGEFEGVACNDHGKVANISLQGKGLYGSLSPAVAHLRQLSGLFLHYNQLNGSIPKEIADLTNLSELYLNVNNFSGTIPPEIGNVGSLQVLELCCNQLSGSIPTQLGLLKKLGVLSLQSNNLTGAIPASLGDLTQLARLDLSFNRLFGSIPVKLNLLTHLIFLDVRNNSLSGSVPSELRILAGGFLFANNSDLCGTGFEYLRECTSAEILNPNRPEPYGPNSILGLSNKTGIPESVNVAGRCNATGCAKSRKDAAILVVFAVVGVVAGCVFLGFLTYVWYRREKQRIGSSMVASDTRLSTDRAKDVATKSASSLISIEYSNGWDPLSDGRSGIGFSEEVSQSLRFNLEEVEVATQYFSDVNLLGKSNFAATYKGILRDGSAVAIKSISKTSCKTEEACFLKGLKTITSLRHDNLLALRGFCCSRGRGECFLVYDFVRNGSLSRYLDVKCDDGDVSMVLDWSTRVSIIKGIAKGMEYLHSKKTNKVALVHQNISVDNILIDHHFNPLIYGAGLHMILVDDIVYSTLKGSAAMGYLAPEYTTTGRFTVKSDVYAFGVVMFQVLAGKRKSTHLQITSDSGGNLDDLVDGNLGGNFSKQEAAKLAGMALLCTSEAPEQRPTMEEVSGELSGLGCSSS